MSTITNYVTGDCVLDQANSAFYVCVTSHASGTLAADVAASKWLQATTYT